MKKLSFIVLGIILFGIPNISHAASIVINPTPGIDTGSGGTGYASKALCEANLSLGNTVCCAKSIYVYTCPTCTTSSNTSVTFTMVNNNELCYGAGSGLIMGTAGSYKLLFPNADPVNNGMQQRWFQYMTTDAAIIDGASCYVSNL